MITHCGGLLIAGIVVGVVDFVRNALDNWVVGYFPSADFCILLFDF